MNAQAARLERPRPAGFHPALTRLRMHLYGLRHYFAAAAISLMIFAIAWLYANNVDAETATTSLQWLPLVAAIQVPCVTLCIIAPAASVSIFAELRSQKDSLAYLAQPISRTALFHEKLAALLCMLLPVWLIFYGISHMFPPNDKSLAGTFGVAANVLAVTYLVGISIGSCMALLLRHTVAALLISTTACLAAILGAAFLNSPLATDGNPTLRTLPHLLGYNLLTWMILAAGALTCYFAALHKFQRLEVHP